MTQIDNTTVPAEDSLSKINVSDIFPHVYWQCRIKRITQNAIWTFHVPSWLNDGKPSTIHHVLGSIQASNDSRWNWFAKMPSSIALINPNQWSPQQRQGRCSEFLEAVATLIGFLNDPDIRNRAVEAYGKCYLETVREEGRVDSDLAENYKEIVYAHLVKINRPATGHSDCARKHDPREQRKHDHKPPRFV